MKLTNSRNQHITSQKSNQQQSKTNECREEEFIWCNCYYGKMVKMSKTIIRNIRKLTVFAKMCIVPRPQHRNCWQLLPTNYSNCIVTMSEFDTFYGVVSHLKSISIWPICGTVLEYKTGENWPHIHLLNISQTN